MHLKAPYLHENTKVQSSASAVSSGVTSSSLIACRDSFPCQSSCTHAGMIIVVVQVLPGGHCAESQTIGDNGTLACLCSSGGLTNVSVLAPPTLWMTSCSHSQSDETRNL